MRLFGRTTEASVSRDVAEATALCEQGRLEDGRKRLEKLVSEAQEALGPDNTETLFAREALAMSYAYDAPARGLQLIGELLPEYERVFGKEGRELLILRAHLPGLYGVSGDHKKAREAAAELLPRFERVFGVDGDETSELRTNIRYADEQIAQGEIERVLALGTDAGARTPPPDDWRVRVRRAAEQYASASAYRSRLFVRFTGEGEGSSVEWQIEYVRPDKLHVLQLGREQGEELADEWIVLGEGRYQNAGLWFKPDEDLNKELNEFLAAEKYVELLREGTPTSVATTSSPPTSAYLVLDYGAIPAAFREYLSGEEVTASPIGQTKVWIDTTNDTLARVDVSMRVQVEDQKTAQVEASQGFTSYGADIDIEAPELQMVPT
jgi:hypothetical protein